VNGAFQIGDEGTRYARPFLPYLPLLLLRRNKSVILNNGCALHMADGNQDERRRDMRKMVWGMALFALLMLSACARIPQAAIDVNRQVSTGITAIGANGQEMVRAWEETGYKMLDDRWSQVYSRAEAAYRKKKGIADGTALTSNQHEDVAGLAALVRDKVRGKIRAEAEKMRGIIVANTKATLEANESITGLLISANAVFASRQALIKEVGTLIPIPPGITEFIGNALQTAGM
jgi:hypothetical protein